MSFGANRTANFGANISSDTIVTGLKRRVTVKNQFLVRSKHRECLKISVETLTTNQYHVLVAFVLNQRARWYNSIF
jgi:hypothetical protein